MVKKQSQTKDLGQILKIMQKWPRPAQIGAGIGALLLVMVIYTGVLVVTYQGKIYPRIYVGDVAVGGLTVEQAQALLAQQNAHNQTPIQLTYQDKTATISPADVGWQFDALASAEQAYNVGRQTALWHEFISRVVSPLHTRHFSSLATFDSDMMANKITAIVGPINKPAQNATASYDGTTFKATPEVTGKVVNADDLENRVLQEWQRFMPSPIVLTLVDDTPTVILGDQNALKTQTLQLASSNLTLKWPNGSKKLGRTDVAAMIDFVGGGSQNTAGQQTLIAQFTDKKVRQFLLTYAAANINQAPVEPKLSMVNGTLSVIGASSSGSVVDLDASTQAIMVALAGSDATKTATLAMKAATPTIDQGNLASLGITTLLGEGITSFTGSPADRTANIKRGVELLNGVLVKPGDEFSTLNNLGNIDASNGFVQGLVIKDNRTVPDYGGGLCQVSTTLFRSVLAAGLKVAERQNHLYRVSYYEPPVGLDATIFSPAPDFKFLNDTGSYILVQAKVDGTKVIFDLWGKSDGRTASVSTPQVISTTPAGDPIYINTDTLNVGTTQQIEHAHDGMKTTATYVVTRNGQVINHQIFNSTYVPWPAQYLVGTHQPN